jgi:acetoin utilization deacetylase AcuC-like enzyme
MTLVGFSTDPSFLVHEEIGHPERPDRLRRLLAVLDETGVREALVEIAGAPVDDALLRRVHAEDQIARVAVLSRTGGGRLDADTYVGPGSDAIARLAAGSAVACVDAVLDRRVRRAFAALRPPGHHATPTTSMGFCLYNNVAIAARHARERGAERVAIVDWDVHHGNGTQDVFYEDRDVVVVSTHQFPLYPGTGRRNEIGAGAGIGATVNVPLPAGAGDLAFASVFHEIVLPVLYRARPDVILIAAGFDAHARDPLAELSMTTDGFHHLARTLVEAADELCDGRVVVCLEGGYDLEAVAWSGAATIAALRGLAAPPDPLEAHERAEPEIPELIADLRALHGLA